MLNFQGVVFCSHPFIEQRPGFSGKMGWAESEPWVSSLELLQGHQDPHASKETSKKIWAYSAPIYNNKKIEPWISKSQLEPILYQIVLFSLSQ